MRALYFAPGHRLTQFEIGNDAKVTSAHVTYLVDGLEKEGWVFRSPHHSDRRMTHVELTEDGLKVCRTLVPAMARFLGDVTSSLSPEEKSVLNRLLEQLKWDAEASYRDEEKAPDEHIDAQHETSS
jgi:MarR family 2-MHQ and catechol resistance regulon transcriptional repressor